MSNRPEAKEHAKLNIIVDVCSFKVCRVELTRVCVFNCFLKNSSTENIVLVIVKNELTAFFHCLYSY